MKNFYKKLLSMVMAGTIALGGFSFSPIDSVQATETRQEIVTKTGSLNFLVLESPSISTGQTQKAIVSVGDGTKAILDATLSYHRTSDNKQFTLDASKAIDDSILFEIKHTDTGKAAYVLDTISYSLANDDNRYEIDLSDSGVESTYGVNTQIDNNENFALDASTGEVLESACDEALQLREEISQMSSKVVAVEEINSPADLTDAFSLVEERSTYAAKKKMVIVLDPGHGGGDGGASRWINGVQYIERDINLKIANACKSELETYEGVTVYLTRTDNTSPLMDRLQRVQYAISKGADVVVSLHINATGNEIDYASGVLAYVPSVDGTNRTNVSRSLAEAILKSLSDLKVNGTNWTNRGLMVDDGLGMIYWPRQYGIPGILIEHGFVNNLYDVQNYLSSYSQLNKIGQADATGIANYYGLKKKGSSTGNVTEPEENDLYKSGDATVTYKHSTNFEKTYVYAAGIEKAKSVKIAVWSDANGKDDLKYYTAKLSGAKWKATVKYANHMTEGKYKAYVYVVRDNGTMYNVGSKSWTIEEKASANMSVDIINEKAGTFDVYASSVKATFGIKKVYMKAWSQSDKKDSHTYTLKLQSDGRYKASFDINNHKYNWGKYTVNLYVKDNKGKNIKVASKKVTIEAPKAKVTTKLNKDESKVTITAKNIPGVGGKSVKKVTFKVWSEKNGKDDARTYTAKANGSSYYYKVPLKRFKDTGKFRVYVYTVMSNGKSKKVASKTFNVSEPSAKVSIVGKKDLAGSFTVKIQNPKSGGDVSALQVQTWTKSDKSDKKTFTPKLKSDGSYRTSINAKDFNCSSGPYKVRVYLTNGMGKKTKVYSNTVKFTLDDPTLKLSTPDNNAIYMTANNIFGTGGKALESVKFKVWSTNNGEDDVKWYPGVLEGSTYTAITDISKHKNDYGKYKVAVYGFYANDKNSRLLTKSITIKEPTGDTPIMGKTLTTQAQLVRYYNKNQGTKPNTDYPKFYKKSDAPTIEDFCQIYIEECNAEGVRAEVAFAQAMNETGFLGYTGDVKIEQYNFAGMGAVGNGVTGDSYDTVRLGIRAQVQHLKGYASTDKLNKACVDKRFNYLGDRRGKVKYVEGLGINDAPVGIGWATMPRYGFNLVDNYIKKILAS